MNSIKNAIVTVTLLAVSYGAYVVLSNPPAEQVADFGIVTEPETVDVDVMIPETSIDSIDPQLPDFPSEDTAAPALHAAAGATNPTNDWSDPFPPVDANVMAADAHMPEQHVPDDTVPLADSGTSAGGYYDQAPASDYPQTSEPAIPSSSGEVASAAAVDNGFEEAWKLAQSSINSGKLDDALMTLSIWHNEPSMSPEQSQRCTQALDELAGTVVYSQESFMEPAYVVQEGETLDQIALKYKVPVDFLARINGVEAPYELYPGETLKVIKGPFRAELNSDKAEITVFLGRNYAGRFPARIGADLPATAGEYEVVAKEPGREYFDRRTGMRVYRDDPSNPYGDYWIGLRGEQVTAAHNVGIHVDTGSPDSGCIAVSQPDAADLNAILSIGSRITVRR